MAETRTYHIHITGQVQGVGFRPFVYRIARNSGLNGWVNNTTDGVHIEINCTPQVAKKFLGTILKHCPPQARIEGHSMKEAEYRYFHDFQIIDSDDSGPKEVRLSPDFGMCEDCMDDMENPGDRRYQYPFTTCTNCGPRFSIINGLPYDRPLTEMSKFEMCPDCSKEYGNPLDRRFYSQTNSCPNCAISLTLYHDGLLVAERDPKVIIDDVVAMLKEGKIGAVKGIGGYLLVCDATNERAILTLRERKNRPDKPFAVMYPGLDQVDQDLICNSRERDLLGSPVSPIVLLNTAKEINTGLSVGSIAPCLDSIGVMLPYAPLLRMIAKEFDKPLVATSGNVSGSPIIYRDDMALEELSNYSDFVLAHNRDIVIAQDDSVAGVVSQTRDPVILRRSRGWAPSYFGRYTDKVVNGGLALGAQMKGSISLAHCNKIYISQYLGDLESYDSQLQFRRTLAHFRNVLDFTPTKIFTDLHPQYFTHTYGVELAAKEGIEIDFIQHHKAHFGAILQESDLIESKEPVLGVIWDGTGYGEDGNIWGGEFFKWQDQKMKRAYHFEGVPYLFGDKMAREPRISALAFTSELPEDRLHLAHKFTAREWELYQKMLPAAELRTTSVGRLFDAVASLLGLIDKASYEGQAAMYLEVLARKCSSFKEDCYNIEVGGGKISTGKMMAEIADEMSSNIDKEVIARKFHVTLVEIIRRIAVESNIRQIAFSGGVFQNSLLIELICNKLADQFSLHFHRELSPNDENVSFGQLVLGSLGLVSG